MQTIENKQTFRQFCESRISKAKFNTIHTDIGVSKNAITTALNTPERMSAKVLVALAEAMNMHPNQLVLEYECGVDTMTAREYLKLLKS